MTATAETSVRVDARGITDIVKKRNIAVAVSDFLRSDLLGQADIGNQPLRGEKAPRNPDIKVAELLDRAVSITPNDRSLGSAQERLVQINELLTSRKTAAQQT